MVEMHYSNQQQKCDNNQQLVTKKQFDVENIDIGGEKEIE